MNPIRKILFITLSNIGDCILTLPVLDALRSRYPGASITVFCGTRPKVLFEHNPVVGDLIVFDKHGPLRDKIRLVRALASRKYDLVVDMRNSLLGLFLPARIRAWGTNPFAFCGAAHMKDRHASVISHLGIVDGAAVHSPSLPVSEPERKAALDLLKEAGVNQDERIVIVSAGARSIIKRWPAEKFVCLIDRIIEKYRVRVVLIGDQDDVPIGEYIARQCRYPVIDLTGRTTIFQAAALLQLGDLLITNDSANLHLASYLNVPVLAVFGPTDDNKYGPWSSRSSVVKKEIFCRPCCKAQCRFKTLACMQLITTDDVFRQAARFLEPEGTTQGSRVISTEYRRIIVMRTDRMGDLILSTPVLKELRMRYPCAYLAVVVRPYTRAVVDGNPYIDEVIVYDKKVHDAGIFPFWGFISGLRRKKFDLALVLHPNNRDHLIAFLSGIRRRIGYDRKMGFLLTDRLAHDKHLGAKHESDYSLDMVRFIGIEPGEKEFFLPVTRQAEQWLDGFFKAAGIKPSERVVVINPGASCPSKIWPPERYAAVADALAAHGCRIVVLAGPDPLDADTAAKVIRHMKAKAVDCVGKAPVPETGALFRRSSLIISADTGPMHIASAAGTAVIAIFGRNQSGISPIRWGPVNKNSVVLHKDVGCKACLAHDCRKGFACLSAISVADVLNAAETLLRLK